MAFSHRETWRVGAASIALSLAFASAGTAHAAQTNGSASATILAPVTLAKQDDLIFGKVIAGASPANVTITADGGFNCGTGLTCLDSHGPARFTVSGAPGQTVRVDVDERIVLTSPGGARMTVALKPGANVMRLGASGGAGPVTLAVGGVLNVGAYQAEGTYTGTFTVNIDYN